MLGEPTNQIIHANQPIKIALNRAHLLAHLKTIILHAWITQPELHSDRFTANGTHTSVNLACPMDQPYILQASHRS